MADEENVDTEEVEEEYELSDEEAGPGLVAKLRKPLLLLIVIVAQAAAAYAVAQFLILPRLPGAEAAESDSTSAAKAEPEQAQSRERGSIVMMEDVVVNLRDIDESSLLMVTTAIEYKEKGLELEIQERMPELRDKLISRLTSYQVEDLIHREGRELVKRQVLEDFNASLQEGQLLNVYFSDFVIQ